MISIKRGDTIFIPFRNGKSISTSHYKPRMYKTRQAFKKTFSECSQGTEGIELVEYAEVKHGIWLDAEGVPVGWDKNNPESPAGSCYCSECGEWLVGSDELPVKGIYCPNCGKKMKADI